MTDMIVYLAQPYGVHPMEAVVKAKEWTYALLQMGHWVFSPILHSHYFHHWVLNRKPPIPPPDYVDWDIQLLEAMREHVIIVMSQTAFTRVGNNSYDWLSKGCEREYYWAKTHGVMVYLLEDFLNRTLVML